VYPKDAEAYLGDWVEKKWLRRWYPANTDVPHYAPTSAVETAAAFAHSLSRREFLGTASRLLMVRDLLRQITAGAAADPDVRLAALQRQRAEVNEQIDALRSGTASGLDDTAIRERYAQAVATARELLGDLRQVEENFRGLDREVRRQATTWSGPRGEFLKMVFGTTAEIGASDQGRSWSAFWEHMTSHRQREELDELLAAVNDVPALAGVGDQVGQLLREELFSAAGDPSAHLLRCPRSCADSSTNDRGPKPGASMRRSSMHWLRRCALATMVCARPVASCPVWEQTWRCRWSGRCTRPACTPDSTRASPNPATTNR